MQAASHTGEAANKVLGSAGGMLQQSDLLRAKVDEFVGRIGAA